MEDQLLKVRVRLFKSGSMLLVVLSIVGIAYFINLFKQNGYIGRDVSPSTIVVSGMGEVVVRPDIATFTYGITEEAKTAAEAQQLSTRKVNDVKAFLKEKKIEDRDIKTIDYSISPKYEYQYVTCSSNYPCPGKQVINGYTVTERVEVKIRKLDDAGAILAGVGQKNVSEISGLNFGVDDPEKAKTEARDSAVEDAQAKAKRLASSLGVSLVRVMSFDELSDNPREAYYGIASMKADVGGASAPMVSPGENKIISNVTITYEIK